MDEAASVSAGEVTGIEPYAVALADAAEAAIGPWVIGAVRSLHPDPVPDQLLIETAALGEEATTEISAALRGLLALDVDEQWTNPLSIIRRVVAYPTQVLAAAGVPALARDAELRSLYPDDVYDLTPASFADLGPEVHEPGLAWGAAKAHIHLNRRRAQGMR